MNVNRESRAWIGSRINTPEKISDSVKMRFFFSKAVLQEAYSQICELEKKEEAFKQKVLKNGEMRSQGRDREIDLEHYFSSSRAYGEALMLRFEVPVLERKRFIGNYHFVFTKMPLVIEEMDRLVRLNKSRFGSITHEDRCRFEEISHCSAQLLNSLLLDAEKLMDVEKVIRETEIKEKSRDAEEISENDLKTVKDRIGNLIRDFEANSKEINGIKI